MEQREFCQANIENPAESRAAKSNQFGRSILLI
jgi:hypothetical protein